MVHIHQAHHLGLDYGANPARISHYHLDLGESCVKWVLFALNFLISVGHATKTYFYMAHDLDPFIFWHVELFRMIFQHCVYDRNTLFPLFQLAGLGLAGLGVYVATAAQSYEEFFGSGSVSLSYIFIG
eukprot:sb/3475406/